MVGEYDADAGDARFNGPNDIVFAPDGTAYLTDYYNNVIRRISPSGAVTTVAGNGVAGHQDGPAAQAEFNGPANVTVDSQGNLFVTEWNNQVVRKISPDGTVSTLAGNGTPGFAVGPPTVAEFNDPGGITVDSADNIYVADTANNRIMLVTQAGVVSTFAGEGQQGFQDGPAATALFNWPCYLRFDAFGNLYVADSHNCAIRVIDPAGTVSTLVGNNGCGSQDGSPAQGQLGSALGFVVSDEGDVYVVDIQNNRVRAIDPAGGVATLAGNGMTGYVDGPALSAEFNVPIGLAADASGDLYVPDRSNNVVRKITLSP